MPRPKRRRWVACQPDAFFFKPRGIPLAELDQVELEGDELEALRLADLEGLYHEDAALRMQVSRQTFGRILAAAHAKVADVLLHGKALRMTAGRLVSVERMD